MAIKVPNSHNDFRDKKWMEDVTRELIALMNAGGSGVTDGDKGDITVSGGGATWNYNSVSSGWTTTNSTPDKTLNANATTINELADVLATLIEELKAGGILS